MFQAFACVANKEVVELAVIKKAIFTLLDEYCETNWFISSDRKNWAIQLKGMVNDAQSINQLLDCLSQEQINVTKNDIEKNKHRGFKSLHFFAHSRYQTTLNHALNVAASLSGKTDVDEVANALTPLMSEVTDKSSVAELTLDELKHRAQSKKRDKNNAAVLINTLENVLSIKERIGPEGMIGRRSLFKQPQRIIKDISLESQLIN